MPARVGDRVIATVAGTGAWRIGNVTAVATGDWLVPNPQYHVHFDGDTGRSGPCLIHRIVRPAEAPSDTP